MLSLLEIANKYTESNKHSDHCVHYFDIYDHHFTPFRENQITLLEIGIFRGGSLRMWKEYFHKSKVIGVDVEDLTDGTKKRLSKDGVLFYQGDATNKNLIDNIISECGRFDIVIDDGSHYSREQISSFQILFQHVKQGGIYIIEDLFPSYWNTHVNKDEQTCVNFCKTLVDYLNYMAYKNPYWKNDAHNYSSEPLTYYEQYIDSIHFYKGIVFIYKSKEPHKRIDE